MILEGRVLLFDSVNINGDIFPKGCEIDSPGKVPLFWNFQFGKCIGNCEVIKDEKGLIAKAVTFSDSIVDNTLKDILSDGRIGVGGYFNGVKMHRDNILIIVEKAILKSVSLTLEPVNEEYYLKVLKEEEND